MDDRTTTAERAVVVFTADAGSSLAAVRLAARFPRLVLAAPGSCGDAAVAATTAGAKRLGRFFGDPGRFDLRLLPTDRVRRALLAGRWAGLRRHGFLALSHCPPCRLALHAQALVLCRTEGISTVADGSLRSWTPGEDALRDGLRALYAGHGIAYETPAWDARSTVAQTLRDLRYDRALRSDLDAPCEGRALDRRLWRVASAGRDSRDLDARVVAWQAGLLSQVTEWARGALSAGGQAP